ncbi:MAG: hypothetical protein C5B53_12430 [Candidatus Melainabacteria bacterium]|nr:MAG: hypothetical protein C5B53_12430 [Candidatus Melainabacteria bacterium]
MQEDLLKELENRLAKLECLISQAEEHGQVSASEAAVLREYNNSLRRPSGLTPAMKFHYLRTITALNNLKQQCLTEAWKDSVDVLAFMSQLQAGWCESALKNLVSKHGEVVVHQWLITKLEYFTRGLEECERLPRGIASQGETPFLCGLAWYQSGVTRAFDIEFITAVRRAANKNTIVLRSKD